MFKSRHQLQSSVENGQQRKRDDKPLRSKDTEPAEQGKRETVDQPALRSGGFRVCTEILDQMAYTGYGKNNAEDDDDARCEAHGIDQQKIATKPSNIQDRRLPAR